MSHRYWADFVWLFKNAFPSFTGVVVLFVWRFVCRGNALERCKRAEPEDERAIENIRKAKSHIYNLFLIILLVQEVFARWGGETLQLTGKKVIIIFGMLQFAEYLHFLRFEKSNSYE